MGATKTQFYTDELMQTAELFKALGHPARLQAFLMMLNETDKEITQQDLSEKIGLSKSTLSVHLNKLHAAGVTKQAVKTRDKKSCLCYRSNIIAVNYFTKFFDLTQRKISIKCDDRYENSLHFHSRLKSTIGWESYFET